MVGPDPRAARDVIERCLRRELFGPTPDDQAASKPLDLETDVVRFETWREADGPWHEKATGSEILHQSDPRYRYGIGVLFPSPKLNSSDDLEDGIPDEAGLPKTEKSTPVPALDIETGTATRPGEAEADDFDLQDANARRQASIAVSFRASVPPGASLQLRSDMGRYETFRVQVGNSKERDWWVRRPASVEATIASNDLHGERGWVALTDIRSTAGELKPAFHAFSRQLGGQEDPHTRLLTVALVNETIGAGAKECLFQAGFSIVAAGGARFLPYPDAGAIEELDDEEQSLRMLYRDAQTYGVGHGCAADWQADDLGNVVQLHADMMPAHEVPSLTAEINTPQGPLRVSMNALAGDDPETADLDVQRLIDGYSNWIEDQRVKARRLAAEHRTAAARNVAACEVALQRMRRGWELVRTDELAGTVFRLANRAMQLQQVRSRAQVRETYIDEGKQVHVPGTQPRTDTGPDKFWRPFQIAFLLACLESIIFPGSSDRSTVDLIFFPTGGGKTEAYLGAAAMSMLARRLRNDADAGTDVIMRYTLRLLTAQQFLRASALICALESIRRSRADLGSEPFSIGIWVGSATTPNTRDEAKKALRDLDAHPRAENPFLLQRCPWCGARIGPLQATERGRRNGVVGYERSGNRVVLTCPDSTCEFSDKRGLPVLVVDDDIYEQRPTLVIGTVDKFAMLAWKPQACFLFGIGADGHRVSSPPTLIIQDELHLISGPLGSMVGLYEPVIESLCTNRERPGIPPKIIASTATIRRYGEQICSLYGRDRTCLFPPPALDANETFFASVARNPDGTPMPGRRYVGVHGPALGSIQTAQVRVAAALLQAPLQLPDGDRDGYWTNLWFFNSLRELGNTVSLLQSDIPDYLYGLQLRDGLKSVRWPSRVRELTSRLRNDQVPKAIDELSVRYGSSGVLDVCLASSIIEVGVDIDRLALMTIVGQPKTTAQYIQVSGRVGRLWQHQPGLVVTIYGATKPRDRSHFERFRTYHERLYEEVEPTSVTPFALPVLERAMRGAAVAYTRQTNPDLRSPWPYPESAADEAFGVLEQRLRQVDPEETAAFATVRDSIRSQWQNWERTEWSADTGAGNPRQGLMRMAGKPASLDSEHLTWEVPMSMRTVDAECQLKITTQYALDREEGARS